MAIIVNTNSREEYNNKINYYQMNGFKISSSTNANIQTTLVKKSLGPLWAQILLIVSLIGSLVYLTEMVMYPLAITDYFIQLNLFSLVVAIKYLQDIGLILLIIFIIMLIVIIYYYFTKPYEVIVKLNQMNNNMGFNNQQTYNNNFNQGNWGNYNG